MITKITATEITTITGKALTQNEYRYDFIFGITCKQAAEIARIDIEHLCSKNRLRTNSSELNCVKLPNKTVVIGIYTCH